ncbi:hypothetical protein Peur_046866 [Populus x canadensis]
MTRNKVADYPQASTTFRKRYNTGETTCDTNAILLRNTFSVGLKNLRNSGKHIILFFLGLRCKQEFKAIAIVFQIILLFHLFGPPIMQRSGWDVFGRAGEVPGLQVLEDRKWLAVDPLPTAFVITIGYLFQVISNGKLKSVDQRVVTN